MKHEFATRDDAICKSIDFRPAKALKNAVND
jgi:hypothetical protein